MFSPCLVAAPANIPTGNDQHARFFEIFITAISLAKGQDAVWTKLWYARYAINRFYPPATKCEGALYALLFEDAGYSILRSVALAMKLQTCIAFLFSGLSFYLLARTFNATVRGASAGSIAFVVSKTQDHPVILCYHTTFGTRI